MTINKVTGGATRGGVDIVDHRVPAGYAPPTHVHSDSDEASYIIDALYRRYPTRDALLDALTRGAPTQRGLPRRPLRHVAPDPGRCSWSKSAARPRT